MNEVYFSVQAARHEWSNEPNGRVQAIVWGENSSGLITTSQIKSVHERENASELVAALRDYYPESLFFFVNAKTGEVSDVEASEFVAIVEDEYDYQCGREGR